MAHKVQLALYDLSRGMAKAMSMSIIGKQIDGELLCTFPETLYKDMFQEIFWIAEVNHIRAPIYSTAGVHVLQLS